MTSPILLPCPTRLALEVIGDRWSLIIVRELMFSDRRHFYELFEHSPEQITETTLIQRLKQLIAAGVLRRQRDRLHSQRVRAVHFRPQRLSGYRERSPPPDRPVLRSTLRSIGPTG